MAIKVKRKKRRIRNAILRTGVLRLALVMTTQLASSESAPSVLSVVKSYAKWVHSSALWQGPEYWSSGGFSPAATSD